MRAALPICLLFLTPALAHAASVHGTVTLPPEPRVSDVGGYWRVENGLLPVTARIVDPRSEVVVVLDGGEAHGKPDGAPVVIELHGLRLDPKVVVVPVGGLVEFRNADRVPHTLFAPSAMSPLPTPAGQTRSQKFATAGEFRVLDEEYPHLAGTVVVTATPYVGQLDEKGGFRIEAPEGHYTLRLFFRGAWVLTRQLDVGAHNADLALHVQPPHNGGAKP